MEHGSKVADQACESLLKSAEHFQQVKQEYQDLAFLYHQTENLQKLYKIFGILPVVEYLVIYAYQPIPNAKYSRLSSICAPDFSKYRREMIFYGSFTNT